jgi:peptidoglycan hydrolase-like protein with peptidoglycan-binding domain
MPNDQGMLTSETVEMIQTRLAELGLYQGKIHGNFDEETVRALKAFQLRHSQVEDVITNPETWRQLFSQAEHEDGYTFTDILKTELFEIRLSRKKRLGISQEVMPQQSGVKDAQNARLVGLALSGGGIRSATFNLGVLQALAELKVLRLFDYLSTVSGGGYIGSWLSALIRREQSMTRVEEEISPILPDPGSTPDSKETEHQTKHESPAIDFLRRHSNYITPKTGLFSGDTWSVVSTYLRNLCLNLVILSGGLIALLLIPRLMVWVFKALDPSLDMVLLPLTTVLLLIGLFAIALNLVPSSDDETAMTQFYASQCGILWCIVLPVLVAALLISYMLALTPAVDDRGWGYWALGGGLVYFLLWMLSWLAGQLFQWLQTRIRERRRKACDKPPHIPSEKEPSTQGEASRMVVPSFAPLAGFGGGLLLWGSVNLLRQLFSGTSHLWGVVTVGPPLIVLVFSATVALHIGLMGRDFPEAKREWWSRLGGWLLIAVVVWIVWFGIAIIGPLILRSQLVSDWVKWSLTSGWLVSTIAGVIAGKSSGTGKPGTASWGELAAEVTPGIFVFGMLVSLSVLTDWVLNTLITIQLQDYTCDYRAQSSPLSQPAYCYFYMMNLTLNGKFMLWMLLGFSLLAGVLSLRVDINEFSMHHLYRNRLIRCYLGASNRSRKPQPFTGFCAQDDVRLRELAPSEPRQDGLVYQGPYLIVNAALNLVTGKELAWQERKAASFIFTPRFCGYELYTIDAERDRNTDLTSCRRRGCYRPTIQYADAVVGISLGTALAISGAAASPNMGYHSSPSLAFLLTVFNVRLGWWTRNPAQSNWMKSGPRFGLKYLAEELFGLSDSRSSFVYLSDGGHFENLGLYELVRRRCRLIVACDATQDSSCEFGDLGNAIRKCNADFGIEIEIDVNPMRPQGDPKYSSCHYAIGTVHYERVDHGAAPGTLVYLKSSLTGDEPTDLLSYHSRHPQFPHQSTTDQWFAEAQFESYRKLGCHIAKSVFGGAVGKLRTENRKNPEVDPEVLLAELRQYGNQ